MTTWQFLTFEIQEKCYFVKTTKLIPWPAPAHNLTSTCQVNEFKIFPLCKQPLQYTQWYWTQRYWTCKGALLQPSVLWCCSTVYHVPAVECVCASRVREVKGFLLATWTGLLHEEAISLSIKPVYLNHLLEICRSHSNVHKNHNGMHLHTDTDNLFWDFLPPSINFSSQMPRSFCTSKWPSLYIPLPSQSHSNKTRKNFSCVNFFALVALLESDDMVICTTTRDYIAS